MLQSTGTFTKVYVWHDLSGKYWYQELSNYLIGIGFLHSTTMQSLFWKCNSDGSIIYLLDYTDDLLYYDTSEKCIQDYEKQLSTKIRP